MAYPLSRVGMESITYKDDPMKDHNVDNDV